MPLHAVTSGPRHHFFGYYDKTCWDGSGRAIACLESGFLDRPPTADDTVGVGIVSLSDPSDASAVQGAGGFRAIARTRAWNWQQGAMLHWLPVPHASGHAARQTGDTAGAPPAATCDLVQTPLMVYNDRLDPGETPQRPSPRGWDRDDAGRARFVAIVRNVSTGEVVRTLPRPIYALSHDGSQAVTLNFSRLQHQRPGYGYAGVPDPWVDVPEPDEDGIFWMDMATGEHRLVVTVAQISHMDRDERFEGKVHRFNHLQFSPDDRRFVFLHRWQTHYGGQRFHRMLTARPDGTDITIVASQGTVSHFDWRDSSHILAWAYDRQAGERYLLFRDRVPHSVEVLGEGVLTEDGHCSFSPNGSWLLTDTYPRTEPYRTLLLYDLRSGRRVDIGRFYSPPAITGEIRCDLHPRWSRDGRQVCFDSVHGGHRQVYVADVSEVTARRSR